MSRSSAQPAHTAAGSAAADEEETSVLVQRAAFGAKDDVSGSDDVATSPDDDAAKLYAYNGLAYLIVSLWGFALLLPWNVMLNAIPYFKQTYPGDADIVFHMTAAYVYPQIPMLLAMVYGGSRVSLGVRIIGCLAAQTGCIVLIPVMGLLSSSPSTWPVLCMIFIIGVTTAVLQSSMFGFTSILPVVFSQGLMTGQGIAGVVAGIAAMVIQATIPDDATTAAVVYFVAAGATLALAAASYVVMMRMPFTKYHMSVAARQRNDGSRSAPTSDARAPVCDDESVNMRKEDVGAPLLRDEGASPRVSNVAVLRRVGVEAAAVFTVFAMTFVVFPGLAPGQLHFTNGLGALRMSDNWWTLVLLLIFNAFDTCGRMAPAKYMAFTHHALLVAAVARFALVPLFYGVVHAWTPDMGDAFAAVLMALFAFTNGYMASIAMMTGPSYAQPHERENAGFIMSFFLQLGILIGSQAAFGFTGGP